MTTRHHYLPCGCGTCGCICAEHSISRRFDPCPRHLAEAVGHEVIRLLAVGLFVAIAAVWLAILA